MRESVFPAPFRFDAKRFFVTAVTAGPYPMGDPGQLHLATPTQVIFGSTYDWCSAIHAL
jgi:hypothetical protein